MEGPPPVTWLGMGVSAHTLYSAAFRTTSVHEISAFWALETNPSHALQCLCRPPGTVKGPVMVQCPRPSDRFRGALAHISHVMPLFWTRTVWHLIAHMPRPASRHPASVCFCRRVGLGLVPSRAGLGGIRPLLRDLS